MIRLLLLPVGRGEIRPPRPIQGTLIHNSCSSIRAASRINTMRLRRVSGELASAALENHGWCAVVVGVDGSGAFVAGVVGCAA